ncbi:hypothetical protein CFOL_v3_13127, partial [Cephalotus follicularis]
ITIFTPQDLPVRLSGGAYFEPYNPIQFARKFGMIQGIPVPYFDTHNSPWKCRSNQVSSWFSEVEKKRSATIVRTTLLAAFLSNAKLLRSSMHCGVLTGPLISILSWITLSRTFYLSLLLRSKSQESLFPRLCLLKL